MEPCYFKNYEQGDAYSYLDIKRDSGFFCAFAVGKWIQEVSDELYEIVAKRTQQPTYKHKIRFCSDGNDQNHSAMLKSFNKDCVNYGQVVKAKDENGKIIGVFRREIIGNMGYDEIKINKVDGLCSYLRARIGCFVRKTRNFAKRRKQITNLLHITQTNYNFIEARNNVTPAMKERLTNKIWTWNHIFNERISFNI